MSSITQTNSPRVSDSLTASSSASSSSRCNRSNQDPSISLCTSTTPGQPCLTRAASDFAVSSSAHILGIRSRRTRTLDLSRNPHIQPRSSSVRRRAPRSSSSSSVLSDHQSTYALPASHSVPSTASELTESERTPKAADSSRFPSASCSSSDNTINMSAKSQAKRSSMLGSLSVADRAKVFQYESTSSTAPPARPSIRRSHKTDSTPSTHTPLPSSSASSTIEASSFPALPSSEASASSTQAVLSHDRAHESVAVIKHARRISVSTPIHRRSRSDVSILDPFVVSDAAQGSTRRRASHDDISPPSIRISSFAEIEQLTAELEANRPRSKTLGTQRSKTLVSQPRRSRAASVLMHSITEEHTQLRLSSSTETIRGVASAAFNRDRSAQRDAHDSFQVSPCVSEDGSIDWHNFVGANYGLLPSISDAVLPISSRKRVYESKLCKADSPTLNDEATWLEEELANCSSDDDDDDEHHQSNSYSAVRRSMDEDEYLTPEGSPLLSPVNIMAPPSVEIMGLGIQDASLLMPGQLQSHADKSADSLLEQVALHEACIRTLHTLSHDERQQATAMASAANSRQLGLHVPSMPDRRSSLAVPDPFHPSLRKAGSNGDFSATQSDSSRLFGDDDDTYDASLSPMADMGHGPSSYDYSIDATGERRASAASYLSTDSTASADISVASHGSSLLYNVHLAAPRMERVGSSDTTVSTRRSSIASSYGHDKAPVKPPRSPLRMAASVLPPLPQESCETPQPSQRPSEVETGKKQPRDLMRMKAMPLPPLPQEAAEADKPRSSKESTRVLRQASRRKIGIDQPQPPARHDSLDAMVAAAPKETQLREEFPERLLGDWMSAQHADKTAEQHRRGGDDEHVVRVEPIPLHKRIHNKDGTTHLPGLGEIVPPSPDVTAANPTPLSHSEIPVYPAARKRLGVESVAAPSTLPATWDGSSTTKTSTAGTLKSKLSGRLGLGAKQDAEASDSVARSASRMERKVSESSLPNVLGRRMRKSSVASGVASAELPVAWKDRIVGKRPSMDLRRPSLASLTSSSTHSSTSTSSTAERTGGGTLLPAAAAPCDTRSRSSLGFRKMLSTITGSSDTASHDSNSEPTGSATTLQALAASTFESPKSARRSPGSIRRRHRYESFMQLSDDDDDTLSLVSSSASTVDVQVETRRKDLTKILGASQVDLSQPMAAKRGGWYGKAA